MAQQTMIGTQGSAAVSNAEYNRRQAMQVWGYVQPMNRGWAHAAYRTPRQATGRALAQHALGTLLVLGALFVMAHV